MMLLAVTQGHHLDHPPEVPGYEVQGGKLIAQQGVAPAGPLLRASSLTLPYLDLWMPIGGVLFLFMLLRRWGHPEKLVIATWLAAISVAAWAIAGDVVDQVGNVQMTEMGQPPAMIAYGIKLGMTALASVCVPLLLHYYLKCGALGRYTLRTFLAPLAFCFIAFCSLWIIMDLLDNLKDFQAARAGIGRVLLFYLGLVPFIFVSVMPAALLLAVLYTLTRMSRANEIVAMLSAGRSVRQILRPIFVLVVAVATMSLAANYYWAPRAEGNREAVLRAMGADQRDSIMAAAVMYRDPETRRVWYVASFPFSLRSGRERLRGVQVHEEGPDGRITRAIHADSATWIQQGAVWRFFEGKEVIYKDGFPVEIRPFSKDRSKLGMLEAYGFTETPWRMVSFALVPDHMGVPELVSYLKAHDKDPPEKMAPFSAHLHHRFAMPWQSFALALVAAPLGIAYSRRGAIGGIAGSIFIFFGIMFLNNLFLNLGKGDRLPPWLSNWIPHILFITIGLVLLHYRSQNKDLPKLGLGGWSRRKAKVTQPRSAPVS